MSTEINHTTPGKFITITKNSISIDLTNIEELRTADTFTQELSTYIKTRSEINKSSNDTNSNAIGSSALGVSTAGVGLAAAGVGLAGAAVTGGGLFTRFATFFRKKYSTFIRSTSKHCKGNDTSW